MAAKLAQLRRRSRPDEEGFDALAIGVVECANDGSPVSLRRNLGGSDFSEGYDYEATVSRLAHIYATRFSEHLIITDEAQVRLHGRDEAGCEAKLGDVVRPRNPAVARSDSSAPSCSRNEWRCGGRSAIGSGPISTA